MNITTNEAGLQAAVEQIINKMMDVWVTEAKRICPVDTGALRDSTTKLSAGPAEGKMSASEEYAEDVEFGTDKKAAQPFIRPGLTLAATLMKMES